eukprot:7207633-Pyramimonas_sp.AAC.1
MDGVPALPLPPPPPAARGGAAPASGREPPVRFATCCCNSWSCLSNFELALPGGPLAHCPRG